MVTYYTRHQLLLPKLLLRKLIGFEVFAPALKAPNSLLREAEVSGVGAFRTGKFGRRKSICQEFNVLISILLFLCFPFLLNCLNFTPKEMIIKTSSPTEIINNKFALDEFDDFLAEKKIKYLKPILNKFQNQYFTASFHEELDWETIENLRFTGIEYIQPNYLNEFSLTPNDPLYPDQVTNFVNTNLPQAWNYTTGNSEIIVGVVDSGIHFGHPDLQTNIFINLYEIPDNGIDDDNNGYIDDWHGWDFTDAPELAYMASGDYIGQDNDPSDELHHGTHVSGIIAADTNNDLGISGICWNTKILPIRCGFQTISGMGGYLQDDDAAAGIIYAADMGASVINCSWGSEYFSQIIADACFYAYDKGSIVVVSSGNTGEFGVWYPAKFSYTISVGAVDENKYLAPFSTYGSQLDLVAPGINVLSTFSEDEDNLYIAQSGTSMSAPFVSASIALLISVEPGLNFEQVHSRLACSAIDLGESGFDNFYGNGLLDAYALLTEVSFPHIEISYPFENAGMSEDFDIFGTVQADDFFRYFMMYTSSETPSALDWFDVETHTNTPKYYYAQVENDFLALFNLPDDDDTYQIKVEVVTNDNKRYSYIQTVHIDQTPAELINIAKMIRFDNEFTSYYVQTVFDDITNLSLTCNPVSGQSFETFSNYADSIHVICLPDNIPENYYSIDLEATNIGNLRTSIANASPIDINYLYINTNIYEQTVLGNELIPIRKPIDFDGDGIKNEFVAKDISENSESIKLFKFDDNNQLFTEYIFQNDFYPFDVGKIHANSLLNVLGLANNKSVLYELIETGGDYEENLLWEHDQVYGGRLIDYNNDGLDEIALIENKTIGGGTRRVISLYDNSFESVHTLLNETATFVKNEFIAVACGNLDNNFSLDIIATDKDGDVLIFEMEDNEYEMVWDHSLPVQNSYYLQIGDFDGDGNDDFCVGGYIQNETDPAKTFSYFEFFSNAGVNNQYESMGYVSFSNVEQKNSITKADLDNNDDDEIIISVPPNLYIIDYQNGQFIPVWKGFSTGTEQNAIIAFSETDTENAKIITNLDDSEMKSFLISRIEDFNGPPTPEAFRAQPLNESAAFLSWISTDSIMVYRKYQENIQVVGSFSEENYIDVSINQLAGFNVGDTLYYQVTALNENYTPGESLPTLWKPVIPMPVPQIQSIMMTGINELKVFFDRQLSNDAISSSHFTVNNGIGKPSSVNFISEQKGLLLRFSNYFLSLIGYLLTITDLTGKTGVPFPDGDYPFVFNEDTIAPEILFVETLDRDIVKLSFTEPIISSTVENLENYTLVLPVIDQYNRIEDIEYFEDQNSYYIIIQMVKNLEYSNQSYFLKLDNIEDLSGNKISNNGNKCQFSLTDISDLKHLIVYPNPFNTNEFDGVRFVNMPLEKAGKIWIYDLSGNLVFNKKIKALTELNNFYIWNGNNNANKKVSSGLYLYIIKMGNSYKKGKIAVIN